VQFRAHFVLVLTLQLQNTVVQVFVPLLRRLAVCVVLVQKLSGKVGATVNGETVMGATVASDFVLGAAVVGANGQWSYNCEDIFDGATIVKEIVVDRFVTALSRAVVTAGAAVLGHQQPL